MTTPLHPTTEFTQVMADLPDGAGQVILVQIDGQMHAWRNRCPHVGVGLDWGDGHCLLDDGRTLLCAMHGATFNADDGFCTGGPCAGKSLEAVPIQIADGAVFLAS